MIKLDLVLYPNSSPTHFPHPHQSPWLEAIAGIRQRLCPRLGSKPVPALCRYYAGSPDQVGKLDRGRTYAPKFPALRAGISPETGEKAQHFPARAPTRRAKRPDIFRHYAPGDPPPDFPAHGGFRRKVGGEVQLRGGAVAWGAHARAKCEVGIEV